MQLLAGERAADDRPGGRRARAVRPAAQPAQRRRPAQRGVRPAVSPPGREHPAGVQPCPADPGRAQPRRPRVRSLPAPRRAPLVVATILVVNGRKVRNPVFVIGAPQAGPELLARAIKRTPGFHMTLGQRWVLPVVQAFARTPSLARDRPGAAALSAFTGAQIRPVEPPVPGTRPEPGAWCRLLSPSQVAEVENVAGEERRRVGYGG